MKYLFTLLFITIGIQAFAAEPCNEPPLPGDPDVFQAFDEILNRMEEPDFGGVRFEKCEAHDAQMREGLKYAGRMMNYLTRNLTNARSNDPAVSATLDAARSKLECANRKLQNAVITCAELSGGKLGWAIPMIGTGIKINPEGHNTLYSRGNWMNLNATMHIGSTIIHEMTHKCGTNDKDYFDLPNNPMTTAGKNWHNTADVYQSWALWGFCLPGPECAARQARRSGQPLVFEE